MARDGLSLVACAALFLGLAGAADDRIANTLAVQTALQQGRTQILHGEYQAAVHTLESQISRIDANPQYLAALRDAYRGLIKTLKLAGKDDEAAIYSRRLQILDPGAPLDFAPLKSAPPKKEEKPPPIQARGKMEEVPAPRPPAAPAPVVDPFSDSNRRKAPDVRGVLAEADRQFKAEKYDQAGALYASIHESSPEALGDAKGRWAYCQLHGIATRLNSESKPVTATELPALEQQVRRAMALTPKLENFGNTLLTNLQARRGEGKEAPKKSEVAPTPAAGVEVKHTREEGAAYSVAETTNFRIFHNLETAQAEEVARLCEAARVTAQKKWFGRVLSDWTPKCDVYLYPSIEVYSRETGVNGSAPGHADLGTEGERVVQRKLHFRLDHPNVLNTVLPHETTHVVLAGNFGATPVPRWADEGMAVLNEPREMVEKHLHNLAGHRDAGQLFNVRDLMESKDYPEPRLIGVFYAQSVSLVDYLSKLHNPQTFSRFLKEGLQTGYEAALKKHYGIDSFNDLQTRWTAHAFKTSGEGIVQSGK